jgi:hypothetical protein
VASARSVTAAGVLRACPAGAVSVPAAIADRTSRATSAAKRLLPMIRKGASVPSSELIGPAERKAPVRAAQ